MAKYTRKNVYANGGKFTDPTILWYARGVAAMKKRKLAEPLAWRFFAGIHGFEASIWRQEGYLKRSDTLPSTALQRKFWKQCQHGTWYFLPWHRGYLLALEAAIRDAVVSLGGPRDWALPYWNYFGPNENKLPPAFASPDWPDGQGNNPLFIPQRYGPKNNGKVYVPLDQVNLDALAVPEFTGVASGGDPGFGGVDTGFEHGGPNVTFGDLENQPHNIVHVLVGGSNPQNDLPGLMSDPDTAGLDPIFYLHHANIDRLWEVWFKEPPSEGNPTEPKWVDGPASIGERGFSMPMPPKGRAWNYTPGEMADLAKLDYTYDDLSAAPVVAPAQRLAVLGAKPAKGVAAMPRSHNVELMGASQEPLRISGKKQVRTSVQLDTATRKKVSASLAAVQTNKAAEPDRVFLNLENVRGLHDATALQVYIKDHPAGTIALFGVRKATVADGEHGGQGATFVLDVTKVIDELHLNNDLDVNELDVRIVPLNPVPDKANVSIGRVSIFRQGR